MSQHFCVTGKHQNSTENPSIKMPFLFLCFVNVTRIGTDNDQLNIIDSFLLLRASICFLLNICHPINTETTLLTFSPFLSINNAAIKNNVLRKLTKNRWEFFSRSLSVYSPLTLTLVLVEYEDFNCNI